MAETGDGSEAALGNRIDHLESKVTHQDEVIEELNRMVIAQWGKLDKAEAQLRRIEERLRELQDGAVRDAQDEPPPPHY
mgnify:CR=1 FL=1